MERTKNYNLLKPGVDDFYDVDDFNKNADIVDQELKRVEKSVGEAVEEIQENKKDLTSLQDNQYVHPTYASRPSGLYKTTIDSTGHVSVTAAVDKTDITVLGIPAQDTKYSHPSYPIRSAGLYKTTVDNTGHISAVTAIQKADITALGIPGQDTVYTHPGGTGWNHIPAGGTANQVLEWQSNGMAKWGNVASASEGSRGTTIFAITLPLYGWVSKRIAIGSGKKHGRCVINKEGSNTKGEFLLFDTNKLHTICIWSDGSGGSGISYRDSVLKHPTDNDISMFEGFGLNDVYIDGNDLFISIHNRSHNNQTETRRVDWEVW